MIYIKYITPEQRKRLRKETDLFPVWDCNGNPWIDDNQNHSIRCKYPNITIRLLNEIGVTECQIS